jgi:hypothetical protein
VALPLLQGVALPHQNKKGTRYHYTILQKAYYTKLKRWH